MTPRVAARTAAAALRHPRQVYYGWWLLAGSVLAMALGSGVSFWAFGLFIEPFEDEFGWSRAEISLAFSISLLVSGLAGPPVGHWIDSRGPRSVILWGSLLTALSYVLLATTRELWQWYLYSAINAVFRQMMFFIPFQALISRWFDRRRGIALSILGAGFSLGGVVVVPVMRLAIDSLGWETAFVLSGLTVAGVFLPLGLLLVRNSPADIGSTVEGAVARGTVETESDHDDLTVGQALRTPNFWVLGVGLLLFFFGLFGFLVHQVPFYESVGVSRGTAAAIVSITAALGLVSRLAFGLVADRIARFEVAVVAMAASLAAGTTALLLDSGPLGIAVFIIFWVFGTGGGPIMEALIITRTFGLASFATILGALVIVENVGLVASPTIAGAIFDATGSYDWALVLFTGTFVGSGALFVLASRLPRPQRRAVAGTSR